MSLILIVKLSPTEPAVDTAVQVIQIEFIESQNSMETIEKAGDEDMDQPLRVP